jgi:hypothetical protein
VADLFLIPTGAENYLIDKTYADVALSIEIAPVNLRLNWYKAGYLKILLPFEGQWLPISTKPILLTWRQIVEIPYEEYRLLFTPENWLESPNFIVKSYAIKYNPMAISNPVPSRPLVGGDVVTPIVASITNTVLLPANPNRAPEGLIVNNANRNLWIVFSITPATAAAPSIKVPANGGAIDIPGSYTGAVSGIWEAGATGTAVTHEFNPTFRTSILVQTVVHENSSVQRS